MRCSYAVEAGCVGKTKVIRTVDYGYYIDRVRKCSMCGETFKTTERVKAEVQVRRAPEESAAAVARKPATLPPGTPAPEKRDIPAGHRFPRGKGCF